MRHHNMWGSVFGPGVGLSGVFGSKRLQFMQDPASEVRRIPLPRTPVNMVKKKGRGCWIGCSVRGGVGSSEVR